MKQTSVNAPRAKVREEDEKEKKVSQPVRKPHP